MNDVPRLPRLPVDAGIRAPARTGSDPGEATVDDRQALDAALTEDSGLLESQTPETRKAVKRSLERFEAAPSAAEPSSGQGARTAGPEDRSSPHADGGSISDARQTGSARAAAQRGAIPPGEARGARPEGPAGRPDTGGAASAAPGAVDRPLPTRPGTADGIVGGRQPAPETAVTAGSSHTRPGAAPDVHAPRVPSSEARIPPGPGRQSAPAEPRQSTGSERITGSQSAPAEPRQSTGSGRITGSQTAPSEPRQSTGSGRITGSQSGPGLRQADHGTRAPGTGAETVSGTASRTASGTAPGTAPDTRLAASDTPAAATSTRPPAASRRSAGVAPEPRDSVGGQTRPDAPARPSRTDDVRDMEAAADVVLPDMGGLTPAAHVAQPDQAAAAEAVQAPNARVAELAEQVAERILVSMPRDGTDGEVRISLKESVLDGSDVRIFREDGQLKVVFVAQTEAAERFLATNRAALQQTLGDRLPEERPQVEVSTPEARGASGEDNEGRSRQQYVPQDDPGDLT